MASSSGTRAGNLCASSKKNTGIFFAGGVFFDPFPSEVVVVSVVEEIDDDEEG